MLTDRQIKERRLVVRRYKAQKLGSLEIVELVNKQYQGYTIWSYYKDTEVQAQQDQEWLDELAKSEYYSQYRVANDSLEEDQRQLHLLVIDPKVGPKVKVMAIRASADMEVTRINLLLCGPMVASLKRRLVANAETKERLPEGIPEPDIAIGRGFDQSSNYDSN